MRDDAHMNEGCMKYEILPKGSRDFFFLGQDSEVRFDNVRLGRSSGLVLCDEDGSKKRFHRNLSRQYRFAVRALRIRWENSGCMEKSAAQDGSLLKPCRRR